jgi:uncharacterized protein YjbI with pentapeptide repeats
MTGAVAQSSDFTDAVLIGARLTRANLRGSRFPGANLQGADLYGADLSDADMRDCVLIGAKTDMAQFQRANMEGALRDAPPPEIADPGGETAKALDRHARWCETGGAEGEPSTFNDKDLRGLKSLAGRNLTALQARNAILYGLDMEGVELQGAKLSGADLRMTSLRGADLRGADLKGAKLNNADLREVQLGPLVLPNDRLLAASIAEACLRYADLSGADLHHLNAEAADMSFARLHGADARKAVFTRALFTGAKLGANFTKMVEDLTDAIDINAA